MSVLNKRNALLGWATWVIGKRFLKWKATDVVPGRGGGNKGKIAAALAAVGGALWFWRRRSGDQSA